MKILMVNDNDPDAVAGGSEHYIADLTRALAADGHEVHWFVLGNGSGHATRGTRGTRDRPGKRVFMPRAASRWAAIARRVVFYPDLYRALAGCIARLRPDVVHLHNNYRHPFTVLAAVRGHGVVQTVHDYCAVYPTAYCPRERSCAGRSVFAALRHGCVTWKLLATEAGLLYGRRFLDRRYVDVFVAPSLDLAAHLERMGYPRVVHVRNFRSLPRAEPQPPADDPVVLYVGSLAEHKGVAILLAAFAELARDTPATALWIVGDGPAAPDLRAAAAEHGPYRVRFLGLRSSDELAEIYRQATVVVLPSLWLENAPLVVIEASAYGRAVVASRVGGMPELVEDGRTGYLFDRGDVDGLAEKLRGLLADPALAAEFGAAGHERLAELRAPERHIRNLLNAYDRARL